MPSSFSAVCGVTIRNRNTIKQEQLNIIEFVLSLLIPVHDSLPKELWQIILAQVEFPLIKQLSRTALDIYNVLSRNLESIREMIRDEKQFGFIFESKGRNKSVSLKNGAVKYI